MGKTVTESFSPGQYVSWRITAQGSNRTATAKVIASCKAGTSPRENWPKNMEAPTARTCHKFADVRDKEYLLLEERLGHKVFYRTPPLSTGFKVATKAAVRAIEKAAAATQAPRRRNQAAKA